MPTRDLRHSTSITRIAWLGAALALSIHVTTACLRLGTFVPSPAMPDFAGVYTAAWALRHNVYVSQKWPPELLQTLRVERGLVGEPTAVLSPPIWAWLLQPLTAFSFPTAAWIWLLLLVLMVAWSAVTLAQLAGCRGWKQMLAVTLLVLTFGPVMLGMTLGQTGPVLLCAALAIGTALRRDRGHARAAAFWAFAVAAKLFPAAWLAALPLTRRWRLLGAFIVTGLLAAILVATFTPTSTRSYVHRMPGITANLFTDKLGLDDQSLGAWVQRVGRPHRFLVHGVFLDKQRELRWALPWSIAPARLRAFGILLVGALAVVILFVILGTGVREPEGAFYLWVLYTLLAVPHMERYDHVLLLPAMAWLWPRGPHQRTLVLGSYVLAAFSRLNHLWAGFLPGLLAALASGFGTCAALLLGYGIIRCLSVTRPTPAN